jgi:hypothetical protein
VTIKMRMGIDEDHLTYRQAGLIAQEAGVGAVALHGRTAAQRYSGAADWDAIADLTGDPSWAAASMRKYFERLERCTYRRRWVVTLLAPLGRLFDVFDLRGHGFDGWLPTSIVKPGLLARDKQLIRAVKSAAEKELSRLLGEPLKAWQRLSRRWFDPNIATAQRKGALLGLWLIPQAIGSAYRRGPREPLLEMAESPGTNLRILSGCFATRLVFDEQNRCTGVEFVKGAHLYRADPNATTAAPGPAEVAIATREVIVAGSTLLNCSSCQGSGLPMSYTHWASTCGWTHPESAPISRTATKSPSSPTCPGNWTCSRAEHFGPRSLATPNRITSWPRGAPARAPTAPTALCSP